MLRNYFRCCMLNNKSNPFRNQQNSPQFQQKKILFLIFQTSISKKNIGAFPTGSAFTQHDTYAEYQSSLLAYKFNSCLFLWFVNDACCLRNFNREHIRTFEAPHWNSVTSQCKYKSKGAKKWTTLSLLEFLHAGSWSWLQTKGNFFFICRIEKKTNFHWNHRFVFFM